MVEAQCGESDITIDGRERHDENIKNDARTRQHFHAATEGPVLTVDVLFFRPAVEDENE